MSDCGGPASGDAADRDSFDVDGDMVDESGWWLYLDFTAELVEWN